MTRYFLIDIFGNEIQVGKFEFYMWKSVMWIVPAAGLLALIGILKDMFL